jgi:hypothetical protein
MFLLIDHDCFLSTNLLHSFLKQFCGFFGLMWVSELCARPADGLCVGQSTLKHVHVVRVNEFLGHATCVSVGSLRASVITGVWVLFVHKYLTN